MIEEDIVELKDRIHRLENAIWFMTPLDRRESLADLLFMTPEEAGEKFG